MSAFLCFGCYDCERTASGESRINVQWHVRIRCFMYQERQSPWRRRNEGGKPGGGRCVPEDGQLSRSGERCGFVDNKANARVYKPAPERVMRQVEQVSPPCRGTLTSVDEGPSTHVYGAPETASLCKVPPVSVFAAKHVSSRLLVIMQSFVVTRRT
jgi:hypothetical protein